MCPPGAGLGANRQGDHKGRPYNVTDVADKIAQVKTGNVAGHQDVHKGMTSRDLTENVEQCQIRLSLELVRDRIVAALVRLGRLAVEHAPQHLGRVLPVERQAPDHALVHHHAEPKDVRPRRDGAPQRGTAGLADRI